MTTNDSKKRIEQVDDFIHARTGGGANVAAPITIRDDNGYTHVIVSSTAEEYIFNAQDELRDKLIGKSHIIIDLSQLSFLPSSMIVLLVLIHKSGGTGNVVACSSSEDIKWLFRTTKLDVVIPLYTTYEKAKKAFTPPPPS